MRVTVISDARRVDLVLPDAVPVAELVPELARSVGVLDAVTVYGGYRLVTQGGRELAGDAGLAIQGVEDGEVIAVASGVDDPPPRVHDDIVEAMIEVVERDLEPWDAAAGRRTASWSAVVMLLVGAGSVLLQQGSHVAVVAAVVVTVVLVLGAVLLSRTRGETDAAVTVALMGCLYAAAAALVIAWDTPWWGTPVAAAGGGTLVAGIVGVVGLAEGRALLLPPVIVGALFLTTGLLMRASSFDPEVVLTTALVLVVIAGSVFPWLALVVTGTSVEVLSAGDINGDPGPVDLAAVSADARVAHEILVALSVTVGALLVLLAPLAVSSGVAGTVVSVMACVVVMLRTRQYRGRVQVLVGLRSGVLGLVSTALSALWLHPDWRPTAAVALSAAGPVLMALSLLPRPGSLRRALLGDLVETVALLTLVPALVVATGLYSSIRG